MRLCWFFVFVKNEVNLSFVKWIAIAIIISNNNNNVSRQISEWQPVRGESRRFELSWVAASRVISRVSYSIFFIYENNKRNTNYALSVPRDPFNPPLDPASSRAQALAQSGDGFLALWHAYNLHVDISSGAHRSLWVSHPPPHRRPRQLQQRDVLCNLETIHEAICSPAPGPGPQYAAASEADIDLAFVCGHCNGRWLRFGASTIAYGNGIEIGIGYGIGIGSRSGSGHGHGLGGHLVYGTACCLSWAFIDLNWVICNGTDPYLPVELACNCRFMLHNYS